jgi:hypothetical protein
VLCGYFKRKAAEITCSHNRFGNRKQDVVSSSSVVKRKTRNQHWPSIQSRRRIESDVRKSLYDILGKGALSAAVDECWNSDGFPGKELPDESSPVMSNEHLVMLHALAEDEGEDEELPESLLSIVRLPNSGDILVDHSIRRGAFRMRMIGFE